MKITLSKSQWEQIGKIAGWTKKAYDEYDAWDEEARNRGMDEDDAYDLKRDYGGDLELARRDRRQEDSIKDAPVAKQERSTNWKASNTENGKYLGPIEFKADDGEYHHFEVIELPDRIVFGGATNVGFMESGYILREEGESTDTLLQEMLSDLETYYNQGSQFVSRIVVNERM